MGKQVNDALALEDEVLSWSTGNKIIMDKFQEICEKLFYTKDFVDSSEEKLESSLTKYQMLQSVTQYVTENALH